MYLMRTEDRELLGLVPCFNINSGWQEFGEVNYVRLVQEKFPNHFYLGEETATEKELERLRSGLKDNEWTWIVDPIDGTLNFVSYQMQSCAKVFFYIRWHVASL
jgi:hypothetical protein